MRISIAFVFSIIFHSLALGQAGKGNAETAYQFFKNGDFNEAIVQYESLIKGLPRDAKYNYYYGACLVELNADISQAVKCLKFASIQKVNKDVFFYLGRSYQLLYEFDVAIESYQKYLSLTGVTGSFKAKADEYISQCRIGKTAVAKIYNLTIIQSDTCASDDLLTWYKPASEVGRVMKNNDFFESGIDPEGVMFLTERGDLVFYSYKNPASSDWDLYKMEKLIDGWSEASLLFGDVNTQFNELYPFLHTDGVTLYFSSDRTGGLGGYDIYKATYDSQKKRFSDVVNMGVPFNSPRDDYFFVCDDYSGKAWFASNRNTTNKKMVVHSIKWDNTIVKSPPVDNNEVKEAAQLSIASSLELNTDDDVKGEDGVKSASKRNQQPELFHFAVADTLEYTRFEHFKSDYALASFKKGFALQNERDSLVQSMKEKRRLYSVTEVDAERSKLVTEILDLEKQTYSLDEKIESHYYQAQKTEQDKIRELVRLGKYYSTSDVRVTPNEKFSINNVTFPADLTLYSDDDFGRQMKQLQDMYKKLFTEPDISNLVYADSLFAWGNVLNIESSRMLERASHTTTQTQFKMPVPFKTSQAEKSSEETPESMVKQARQLKLDALKLYHRSLDDKYLIYRVKFREIKENSQDGEKYEQTMSYAGEAMTYYKAGDELINQSQVGIDLETYEKSGTLKRSAVNSQEKGLLFYIDEINDTQDITANKTPVGIAAPSYPEIHKGADATTDNQQKTTDKAVTKEVVETPQEIVAQALAAKEVAKPSPELNYKIQIGVFRNKPDATTLDKLENVTSDTLPESGLMKYYTGNFVTYEDAVKKVTQVRQTGFEGAFVVAFYQGKQIAVSQARELQNKN